MTSGFSAQAQPRDVRKEEANRKLVVEFYEKVFIHHDVESGIEVLAESYIQHNPVVPNGKQGFASFFEKLFKEYPEGAARIIRVAADGDFVWVNAHLTTNPEDRGFLVVDMFRVEDGMLVEHWDVMQNMPETSLNPMF